MYVVLVVGVAVWVQCHLPMSTDQTSQRNCPSDSHMYVSFSSRSITPIARPPAWHFSPSPLVRSFVRFVRLFVCLLQSENWQSFLVVCECMLVVPLMYHGFPLAEYDVPAVTVDSLQNTSSSSSAGAGGGAAGPTAVTVHGAAAGAVVRRKGGGGDEEEGDAYGAMASPTSSSRAAAGAGAASPSDVAIAAAAISNGSNGHNNNSNNNSEDSSPNNTSVDESTPTLRR